MLYEIDFWNSYQHTYTTTDATSLTTNISEVNCLSQNEMSKAFMYHLCLSQSCIDIEMVGGGGGDRVCVSFTRLEFLEDRDHILLVLVVSVPGKSVWILADFLYWLLDPRELTAAHIFIQGVSNNQVSYASQPLGGDVAAFL